MTETKPRQTSAAPKITILVPVQLQESLEDLLRRSGSPVGGVVGSSTHDPAKASAKEGAPHLSVRSDPPTPMPRSHRPPLRPALLGRPSVLVALVALAACAAIFIVWKNVAPSTSNAEHKNDTAIDTVTPAAVAVARTTHAVPGSAVPYVRGIDVSHFQGEVDWGAVVHSQPVAERPAFAFIKKSQGGDFRDPKFKRNWEGAHQAGVPRGAYHVFVTGHHIDDQIANFLRGLDGDPGELPPVIDLEAGILLASGQHSISVDDNVAAIGSWLEQIESALKVTPMIYAGHKALVRYFKSKRPFDKKYPLWVAEYTEAKRPRVPAAWTPWLVWQFHDRGTVDGIRGDVDLSRVHVHKFGQLFRKSH